MLKPYISDQDFRSFNANDAGEDDDSVGYTLYVFDKRYQKNLEAAQPSKRKFKFSEDVPAGIRGYGLDKTKWFPQTVIDNDTYT